MDYMQLVTDAWRIMWGRPKLWLLGILAGLGACNAPSTPSFNYQFSAPSDLSFGGDTGMEGPGEAEIASALEGALLWLAENWWIPVAAAVAFLVLVFILMALGVLARGALVAAAGDGEAAAMPLGAAWGRGITAFWRLTGLFLLLFLFVLPPLLLGIVMFIAGLSAALAGNAAETVPWLLGVAALALLPFFIYVTVVQIVGLYAERDVVLLGAGPWDATRRGMRLFRANLARSGLLWLLWLGMNLAASMVIGMGAAAALLITGGAGFLMGLALRAIEMPWAVSLLPGLALVLPVIGLLFLIGGALQTFWTAYWNLAWQRLQLAPAGAAGVMPSAAPPPDATITGNDDDAPTPPDDGGTATPGRGG